MNRIRLVTTIVAGIVLFNGGQAIAGKTSVEMGRKLFNDTTLGGSTNDKSCNSCHPAGEGLERAADNKKIVKIVNQCITGPMAGNKIDGRSAEMRSLKMHFKTLAAQ